MHTQVIGLSDLTTSRLAYGCWRLAGSEGGPALDPADARRAVIAAIEAGYTLFDHADIYGRGECERRFGLVLREMPEIRDQITIATKCGIRPPWDGAQHCYDSSPAHITASVEASLRALRIETVDLLMLHRPDFLADPAGIAAAFTALRDAGKVRWFGVSNHRPSQFTTLQRACDFPLIANQIEISLTARAAFDDGTLDQCLADTVTPLAWSPLARGALFSGGENELTTALRTIAARHGADPAEIALAWLLHHPARILPIIGSTRPARIRDAARATSIALTREDWYHLLIAARGSRIP